MVTIMQKVAIKALSFDNFYKTFSILQFHFVFFLIYIKPNKLGIFDVEINEVYCNPIQAIIIYCVCILSPKSSIPQPVQNPKLLCKYKNNDKIIVEILVFLEI